MAHNFRFWLISSLSAAEIATSDVVYEIARGQRMRKKQVSRKKSVGRGSNAAHFTYNMRHVHHISHAPHPQRRFKAIHTPPTRSK
jgi:hypothetical protein